MKANINLGNGTGGKRPKLSDIIPLKTPLGIYIFPIYACNFKCKYCLQSIPKADRKFQLSEDVMEYTVFKKSVDDMKKFQNKVKTIRFAGLGEPLLHKRIVDMIDYLKKSEVCDNVEIITNGSLLTKEISDQLINVGLDRLSISLQGINAESYEEISNVKLNYDHFVDNIKYFYENKTNTKVYIKILDCCLKGEEDKLKFKNIFGDICDFITIENVSPIMPEVDYSNILESDEKSVRGKKISDNDICSFPFYMMQINSNGDVIPCCSAESIAALGNVKTENLVEIWNGEKFNMFRKLMLKGVNNFNNEFACKKCKCFKYSRFDEDIIEKEKVDKIIDKF